MKYFEFAIRRYKQEIHDFWTASILLIVLA